MKPHSFLVITALMPSSLMVYCLQTYEGVKINIEAWISRVKIGVAV
jgi:hypothetical protein